VLPFESVLDRCMSHKRELKRLSSELDIAQEQTADIIRFIDLTPQKLEDILQYRDRLSEEELFVLDKLEKALAQKSKMVNEKRKNINTLKMLRRRSRMLKI